MIIQIDTRERPQAIKPILETFERRGVKYIRSKLYAGDYIELGNPLLIIDRKQDIREIASNCTSDRKRVEAELQKVKEIGAELIFLITQDQIEGRPIHSLEDIMLWVPEQGAVSGLRVYRNLASWEAHYPIRFEFCSKAEAGARILQLLGVT